MWERTVEVMGTEAHLVIDADDDRLVAQAVERLAGLEDRWTRFRPDSELSRLNAAAQPMTVGSDTALLVDLATLAWQRTGGRFDPTTGPALVAAGYDRSFDRLHAPIVDRPVATPSMPALGCDGVAVVADLGVVRLPEGVTIDPGGIGKGLAADLVAAELVAAGARGALVSVGGDLRVSGSAPEGGWRIELDHGSGPFAHIGLTEGAVATSSVRRRRWRTEDGTAHHVIDPRTGRPTSGRALACTVVAGEAWWAEALATAVLVAWEEPDGPEVVADLLGDGAAAVVSAADGRVRFVGERDVIETMEIAA